MKQETLSGDTFEPVRVECQEGAACHRPAEYQDRVRGAEVLMCEECAEEWKRKTGRSGQVRELNPGEKYRDPPLNTGENQ